MGIWQNGETYLVRITNKFSNNYGKIIKVKYSYFDDNAYGFYVEDLDDHLEWADETYIDDDFELVDERPIETTARYWVLKTFGEDIYEDIKEKLIMAYKAGYFNS